MATPNPIYVHCTRCHLVPCTCGTDHITEPQLVPIEAERPGFEAFIRQLWPEANLARYGHTYADHKVRNRWIGWCAHAHGPLRVIAKRA